MSERLDQPAQASAAPEREIGPTAGIVRTEADTILEALESEEYHSKEREQFFEGRRLTNADRERAVLYLAEVMRELNKGLVACNFSLARWQLEHMGRGVRLQITLRGTHTATVDYHFSDQQRARLFGHPTKERDDRLPLLEAFGRELMSDVHDAVFVEDVKYRNRAGLA